MSRFFCALLIACALLNSSLAPASLAQQNSDAQTTRPRRAATSTTTQTDREQTNLRTNEPTVRVGLLVEVRRADIAATSGTVRITDIDRSSTPSAPTHTLLAARVNVEARSAPTAFASNSAAPLPQTEVATDDGASTSSSTESANRSAAQQTETNGVRLVNRVTASRGELLVRASSDARPLNAGFIDDTAQAGIRAAPLNQSTANDVSNASATGDENAVEERLTVRSSYSTRGRVEFAAQQAGAFLKLAGKTYRGKFEAFFNNRGSLTIVNVVGLEDYVHGVVPNEMPSGDVLAYEAVKAQAIAARTYAVKNRDGFLAQGFDVLPTTRSQVYGGRSSELVRTSRAVEETRGVVLTHDGAPINALYTSTCGGHTEDAENIFNSDRASVAYLRGRACAFHAAQDVRRARTISTTRPAFSTRLPEHANSQRDAALLTAFGFNLPARTDDDWLRAALTNDDALAWLARVATLARRTATTSIVSATNNGSSSFAQNNIAASNSVRPSEFGAALLFALDGESRARVLISDADADYFLQFKDQKEIPEELRSDVALLVRDGHLQLNHDQTLRPREPLTRARAIRTIVSLLTARNLLTLQRATLRQVSNGNTITVRAGGGRTDTTLPVSPDAALLRSFGETYFQTERIELVGGETVAYHLSARLQIDYLEVKPATNGAAADRASSFSFWTAMLTPAELTRKLPREASRVGAIQNMRVLRRGVSQRVLELEVSGTAGTTTLRGGRIRSALGLREQLFVIDRETDNTGRVTKFLLTGRGWGHGVGMCQYGALGMARLGATHTDILRAYYSETRLTKMY